MGKVKTTGQCQICDAEIEIIAVKPSYFQPSLISKKCDGCGTQWQFLLKKIRGESSQIGVDAKVLQHSAKGAALLEVKMKATLVEMHKAAEKAQTNNSTERT